MAINKKLIHFESGKDFDDRNAKGEILKTSICWIRDRNQIWTHEWGLQGVTPELLEKLNLVDTKVTDIKEWKDKLVSTATALIPTDLGFKQFPNSVQLQYTGITPDGTPIGTTLLKSIVPANADTAGVMSATDKTKLDSLYTNELIDSKLFLENGDGNNSIQLKNRENTTSALTSTNLGIDCTIDKDSAFSFCEGYGNLIINSRHSHAEGSENIIDTGDNAYIHVEGNNNIAYSGYNHIEGKDNITYNSCEHAQGCFNLSTKNPDIVFGNSKATLHSVGNGGSKRHNAHEITQDGTHYIPDVYATDEDGILYKYYEKPMINLLEKLHNLQEACSPTKISDTTALMVVHVTDGMNPMDTLMADDDPDKYMYQEIYRGLTGYMGMLVLDPNFLTLIFSSNYVLPGSKRNDSPFSREMVYAKVNNIMTSADENSDPIFYLFTTIGFDKVCVKLGRNSGDIYKI